MTTVYQKERFEDIMGELPELFYAHNEEFPDPDVPMDVDWLKFIKVENGNVLHIMTARKDGKLTGYIFVHLTSTSHHKSTKLAASDLIYVMPRPNRGLILRRLIKETEKMVRDLDAKKLYLIARAGTPTAKLLRAMGYALTEEIYACLL